MCFRQSDSTVQINLTVSNSTSDMIDSNCKDCQITISKKKSPATNTEMVLHKLNSLEVNIPFSL